MKKLIFSTGLAALALAIVAFAQTKPVGQTKALSHAIHAVDDLDKTLAFYNDVFGLKGTPQDFANPAVPLLTNASGVTLRLSMLTLPGTRFELTHFKGLERKPGQAKYTDPGAASLVFYVRHIDGILANAIKKSAPIVTTGGIPVEIMMPWGKTRSIILRDPDGFFLQLIEETRDDQAFPINDVSLAYTMENADATKNFYTGMMGIDLTGSATYSKDPALMKLVGAPEGTEFRRLSGMIPATPNPVSIEFTEFKGVPRTKFHLRVRDPGAPALAIQVTNHAGMIAQMKAAGVNVISKDGEIVDFGGGTTTIFMEDPNGMNIEIFERGGAPQGKQGGKGK